MAKSDARRTKGQAKPGKERGAPGAVRAGEDAKTGGGGGKGSGQTLEWSRYPYKGGDINYSWIGGDGSGGTLPGNDKPQTGRTQSVSKVGMETGNDSGGSVGAGAEAKGGERAAGVSKYFANPGHIPIGPELDVPRCDYDRGLHRAAGVGATGAAEDYFAAGYAVGCNEQDWPSTRRTYRWAGAALLIGVTLGLLLPLAYQMVSRG